MALPEWLASVPAPSTQEADRLRGLTTNWMKLNAAVMQMNMLEVQQLLALEVNGPCRPFIISRLFTRVERLRSQSDREALLSVLPPPVAQEVNRIRAARTAYRINRKAKP